MTSRFRRATVFTFVAVFVIAIAVSATCTQAATIAFNSFEGVGGELGYSPAGTGSAVTTGTQQRTGSQSLLFDAPVTGFSVTFDPVDISGFRDVELEIYWLTQASAFESNDTLTFAVTHDGTGAPVSPIIQNISEAELDTTNVWSQFFTAIPDDATTLSLTISATNTEATNEDIFFDDLLITGTVPPPVPEPSTLVLSALSLMGVARLRRRRR